MKLLIIKSSRFLYYLSLLGPNILLSTLFSNALSLCLSVSVSDHVSHPYETPRKITVLCILIFIFLDSKLEKKSAPIDSLSSTF
jgi:hypothetical protein